MKRTLLLLGIVFLVVGTLSSYPLAHRGPAPNSGDGIPDGSGFDSPNGPNGGGAGGNGPAGPAPNSGDGIPDGSGFVSPNGPNTG